MYRIKYSTMNKLGSDPKVKKTLIRNYEQKVKPSARKPVVRDVACSAKNTSGESRLAQKENELSQPTLCSSEALANYLCDVKKSVPAPSVEDLGEDKGQLCTKMTKKLNFHFNDKIYKNLIELNANMVDVKNRKTSRPSSSTTSVKRDLEPNIEDFYEDEKESDSPPSIPVIKPKYRPIKKVEEGHLHELLASLEYL